MIHLPKNVIKFYNMVNTCPSLLTTKYCIWDITIYKMSYTFTHNIFVPWPVTSFVSWIGRFSHVSVLYCLSVIIIVFVVGCLCLFSCLAGPCVSLYFFLSIFLFCLRAAWPPIWTANFSDPGSGRWPHATLMLPVAATRDLRAGPTTWPSFQLSVHPPIYPSLSAATTLSFNFST